MRGVVPPALAWSIPLPGGYPHPSTPTRRQRDVGHSSNANAGLGFTVPLGPCKCGRARAPRTSAIVNKAPLMTPTDFLRTMEAHAIEIAMLREALIAWGDAGVDAYAYACAQDGTPKADMNAAFAVLDELRAELIESGLFNLEDVEPPED